MKRFFSFLVLAVFFTGCDDGDMEEVSFEFNETAALPCGSTTNTFFIYKTTDQRALILKLAENNFVNTVTSDTLQAGVIELDISSTANQLIYRVYNDVLANTTICSLTGVPAAYPVVTEQRNAHGGKMYVKTTALKSEEATNGSTSITEYLHTITFKDISFITADGTQRNESLPAITYKTQAPKFLFDNLSDIKTCTGNGHKLLFRYLNDQAMSLRLDEEDAAFLFSNTLGVKERYLNTENTLTYRFFSRANINPLTDGYFCSAEQPDLPAVKHTWTGNNSTNENTGKIEVLTEQVDDNAYKHTITLKNVTMARSSQNFRLKRDFIFGEVKTTTTP